MGVTVDWKQLGIGSLAGELRWDCVVESLCLAGECDTEGTALGEHVCGLWNESVERRKLEGVEVGITATSPRRSVLPVGYAYLSLLHHTHWMYGVLMDDFLVVSSRRFYRQIPTGRTYLSMDSPAVHGYHIYTWGVYSIATTISY